MSYFAKPSDLMPNKFKEQSLVTQGQVNSVSSLVNNEKSSIKYGKEEIIEKDNSYIYFYYTRNEYDKCLKLIDNVLAMNRSLCEFALYTKALIQRKQGKISESMELFRSANLLNPNSLDSLKQVGRSLYLLGKFKTAFECFSECQKQNPDDWEIWHNMGLCQFSERNQDESINCFRNANMIEKHDTTFIQLGKAQNSKEEYKLAINVQEDALLFSPENTEILTQLGLLHLRMSNNFQAFEHLGNSLTQDPKNTKTILAAGSIIQDNNEHDAALLKYRISAIINPNSSQLWNNIGMCFFGKQKFIAAISCLKRSLFLDPFEWITSYNLGLSNLHTKQYASAFHYFSTAINFKPDFAQSYMQLGLTLGRLNDIDNSIAAYNKAIEIEKDYVFQLNYSITLLRYGDKENAIKKYE